MPRRIPAEIVFDMMVQATRNDENNAKVVSALNQRALSIPGSGNRNQDRTRYDRRYYNRGYNGSQIFNTTYAVVDTNEPPHCGISNGPSAVCYLPP